MNEYKCVPLGENVEEMFIGPFGSSLKNECFVDEDEAYCMVYEQKHAIQKTMDVETRYVNEQKYNELKRFNIHGGDIIVSCRGTIGETFVVPEDAPLGIMHPSIMKIRLKDGVYDKYYFNLLLKSRLKKHEAEANGSGIKMAISATELGRELFPVPTMQEQQEITDIISGINDVIEKRKQELSALDDLIKARFVEMFGTPYINEKGFPMKSVDDVIEFIGGAQPDKKYFEYAPTDNNIRLIQIRDYKTDNYVTYIPKSMAKRFCDADDIMIGRYGPPIFQILKGIEGSYNVALMKATPKMGNKEFIRYFLKQDCLFNYLDGLSQRTAGQSGIEMPALKAYPFPYPPLELQNQFADFVHQVDKSKVAVQKALDETKLLFDSLMQQYFG